MKIFYMFWMGLICLVQVPAWLIAKIQGKSYQWWGGAQ